MTASPSLKDIVADAFSRMANPPGGKDALYSRPVSKTCSPMQ